MLRGLHHAIRVFRSWRLGAVAAIITLAIGIGTASSMYALVRMNASNTIANVEDMPAVARIYASSRTLGVERVQLTFRDVDLLRTASAFTSVGTYAAADGDITAGGQPVRVSVGEVSAGLFPALRIPASAGRLISDDDFRNDAPVAIVSDRFWRAHFRDRSIGDVAVTVDRTPRTIVGVLPSNAAFPFIGISADVWIPFAHTPETRAQRVTVLARLRPGVTWTAAAAELDSLARLQSPEGLWTWSAIPVQQDVNRRRTGGILTMFGPGLVVLLIGCTNVACMLLARGTERDMELSVRSALGATRWRIVRQLLGEQLVLALASGALGVGVAYLLLQAVAAAMAQFRPDAPSLLPSATMLIVITFWCSLTACVLFGTLPAIRVSRRDLVTSLKGGTSPAVARFVGYRARDLIVFLELGLAVSLVVTTGLFTRFFIEIQRITPSFSADKMVAIDVPANDAARAAERVWELPGIVAVTAVSDMPGSQRATRASSVRAGNGRMARVMLIGADASFFRTLGVSILRGRSFDRAEADARAEVAVVSEAAAGMLWPGDEPIGARLEVKTGHRSSTLTVVGISRNALDAPGMIRTGLMAPEIYLPLDSEQEPEIVLLARASGDPRLLLKPVAAAARPSASSRADARVLNTSLIHADSAFVVRLFGGFSVLALLLAASGIFGVVSQSVAQRKTEFGVRMAMGASPIQVLRMIAAREARLMGAAIGTGLVATLLVTRSAFVEMLAISGGDPRLWMITGAVCGGTAAVAVAFATWRIVRLDPCTVLRQA